ncbi:MAG: GDP-mannose 4,6-dehydratase [Desulfomonile tiedjei]|nr:GDP-mannose 4,6-dehydratase [Desulfomonile tiedjei]
MNGLKGRRVLVTGGAGFIASHLTSRLHKMGARVGIVTKYNSVIDNVRIAHLWNDIETIEADLRNLDSLKAIARFRPEVIFHFAAYNHVGDSFSHVSEALDCNLKGTANLLESYSDYDRLIYISTSEVYGLQAEVPFREDMCPNPISPYAIGKYAGELYCRMKTLSEKKRIVVLRPFNAFGPYQSPRAIIAEMIINCLRGTPIESTEGKQTREFNFVGNLVDGFILAAQRDEALGQIINLASNREVSIRDLISRIWSLTDSKSELRIGALKYRPTEIWRMAGANDRAQELLGWSPRVSLEEGLTLTAEWYRRFLAVYAAADSPLASLGSLNGD